jgi:F-type H+-transporting ATPase subunit a
VSPGGFQAAVEILFEMVDNEAKGIVHNADSRKLGRTTRPHRLRLDHPAQRDGPAAGRSAAAAVEKIYGATGGDPSHAYLRVVPTADLSVTMGLAVGVLIPASSTTLKIKGLGGWLHELSSPPSAPSS